MPLYRVCLDMRPILGCPIVALTDPASLEQIVRALKNEDVLPRNARFSSFEICEAELQDKPGDIYINRVAGGDWDWPLRLELLEDE